MFHFKSSRWSWFISKNLSFHPFRKLYKILANFLAKENSLDEAEQSDDQKDVVKKIRYF